jgi:hypothetical protein
MTGKLLRGKHLIALLTVKKFSVFVAVNEEGAGEALRVAHDRVLYR